MKKPRGDEQKPAAGSEPGVGISFHGLGQEMSPQKRLAESIAGQPEDQSIMEAGGTMEKSVPAVPTPPPRTGVGTPDQHAEAAGAELGGDTGDVGTPRNEVGDSFGGTHGTSGTPEASDVVQPGQGKGTSRIKRRAA